MTASHPKSILLLSGLSGAGKTTALKTLEDMGWEVVDNLPLMLLDRLLDTPLPKRTLVNVNFPALPADQIRGIRAVRQGFHDYSRGTVVEGRDPRGFKYYWFGLQAIEHTLDHGTDLEAIPENKDVSGRTTGELRVRLSNNQPTVGTEMLI